MFIYFNPRSPWGERLDLADYGISVTSISIHALREESDLTIFLLNKHIKNFNPRSPWGERHE